jgi:hypothetical protein
MRQSAQPELAHGEGEEFMLSAAARDAQVRTARRTRRELVVRSPQPTLSSRSRAVCLRLGAALLASASAIGCASVTHDPLQAITIETVTNDQRVIPAAECRAANDAGTYVGTNTEIKVRRSSDHLDIQCRHPDHGNADARVISRANAGLVGNVLVGGVIGAMVDQSSGAGYSYPTWVRLVFGKSLVLDKSRDQPGRPQVGVEPGQQASAAQ